ncbi:MAG: AAA family ATPase [Methylophilus sp.]
MTKENLKFLVRSGKQTLKGSPREVLVLTTDNWNDYGHNVQFHLAYIDISGNEERIGTVKILHRTNSDSEPVVVEATTILPATEFTELDKKYISLGQEDEYYKTLHEIFAYDAGKVLEALGDIAWRPALAGDFEPTSAFRNAMMRENGAKRSRRFGRAWTLGDEVTEKLAFTYSCTIDGADAPIDVSIAFNGKDALPGRVVGIIGRNAVGKTRFMAKLGEDLAQISRTSAERLEEREKRFPAGRPLFTRIIAISYSAFDRFKRPPQDASSSYVYCGIRNEKGGLSRTSLIDTYHKNLTRIRERGLQSDWIEYMRTILGDLGENLANTLEEEISLPNSDEEALSLLSSGQSILCHFVTALLAWIQPNSLILFDEPETHLHPNAVASLFVVLTKILKSNDSYAIVATHSPVVIQELPAKRVMVFQRTGNLTTAEPLTLESFGESITELTRHVFGTIEVENLYRTTLRDLAEEETAEEVMKRFDRGLSLSAQAYLLAQYSKSNK